jgi:predicted dehydrogenase
MRILIVGGGGIGERHLRCFLATGQVQASLCEAQEERVKALQEKYQLEETYTDFYAIPLTWYQAVVIATPAHLHLPMAMECAKAGVPFLLEKPLAVDLAGVEQLLKLVEERGVTSGVAYMRRSLPSFKKLKELVDSGISGEIKMGRFNSSQDYRKYRPDYQQTYYAKAAEGGGCLLDAASHSLNLAQWYFGEAQDVAAMSDRLVFEGVEAEDCSIILIRFADGSLVEVFCNQFQKPNTTEIELIGTKANLKYIVEGELHRIFLCQDDSNRWRELASYQVGRDTYYLAQALDFLAAIRGEGELPTSLVEGKRTLEIALLAKRGNNCALQQSLKKTTSRGACPVREDRLF